MRLALTLVGLLITVAIVAFLATKSLSSLSGSGNPKQSVDRASAVKNQTDFSALETKLNDYFISNNSYPADLTVVNGDENEFNYTLCASDKALITQTGSNTTVVLKGGNLTSNTSC